MDRSFEYRGYKIDIIQDDICQDPQTDDNNDDIFMVYDHRNFTVKKEGFNPENIFNNLDEYKKYYYVFPVFAHIHSGVILSLAHNGDKFDTSMRGFILVLKENWDTDEIAKNAAQSLIEVWNDYLSGNVYGYRVYKPNIVYSISKEKFDRLLFEDNLGSIEQEFNSNTEWEEVDSCWSYYGNPEKSGCIGDAKSVVDNDLEN